MGKYTRINEAGINKKMSRIYIETFARMESFSVFRIELFFLVKASHK